MTNPVVDVLDWWAIKAESRSWIFQSIEGQATITLCSGLGRDRRFIARTPGEARAKAAAAIEAGEV